MRRRSLMSRNSGTYTSPGTPDYRDGIAGGFQKGWSSERVPLPSNRSRRHISSAALLPFNSGRTLPSKWDDAERWITSPGSGFGVTKASPAQAQRRPKSKSGPLGPPGVGCCSTYSPAMPVRDFTVASPFTTGVIVPDGLLSVHYGFRIGSQPNPVHTGIVMAGAASLPGWSDFSNEILDGTRDVENMVSRDVSRRDMATQMSPRDSTCSSPKGRQSFSTSPPIVEPHSNHFAKLEIRDVQVDKRATVTRQSKKQGMRKTKKGSPDVNDITSSWDISEATKNVSKHQKEEAKIAAWENLQKAKAEAAVRNLEMKLEKKKSASMDKIFNKLRDAQMKAQDMRSSMSDTNSGAVAQTTHKFAFFRKCVKMALMRDCFTCRAS